MLFKDESGKESESQITAFGEPYPVIPLTRQTLPFARLCDVPWEVAGENGHGQFAGQALCHLMLPPQHACPGAFSGSATRGVNPLLR